MTIFQSSRHIADSITKNCIGDTLLLLSGGSSAKIAIKALQLLPQDVLDRVTVSLSDERFVDAASPDSNWRLLESLGLSDIAVKKIAVLSSPSKPRETTTADFAQALATALSKAEHVITILGIGTDNHTAGILPNSEAAHATGLLVTDYATDTYERITITPAFFENIDYAYLYAEGADKKTAIELLDSELDPVAYPAQLLKKSKSWEILYNEEAL